MGDEQYRLGDVVHHSLDQTRLVIVDQRHDVPARNVGVVGDDEALRQR